MNVLLLELCMTCYVRRSSSHTRGSSWPLGRVLRQYCPPGVPDTPSDCRHAGHQRHSSVSRARSLWSCESSGMS